MKRIALTFVLVLLVGLALGAVALAGSGSEQDAPSLGQLTYSGGGGPAQNVE